MPIEVSKPGLATSVQDRGREGYYHVGVPPSGALDQFSLLAANLLVGNDAGAAGLECAYQGPELVLRRGRGGRGVRRRARAARRRRRAASRGASFDVPAGATLTFGHLGAGARAYIAVAGGIDVEEKLGSRSTYALGGLGGLEGRPLAKGDELPVGERERRVRRAHGPGGAAARPPARARGARGDGPLRPPAHRRGPRDVPGVDVGADARSPTASASATRARSWRCSSASSRSARARTRRTSSTRRTRSARSRCPAASSRSSCTATRCRAAATR